MTDLDSLMSVDTLAGLDAVTTRPALMYLSLALHVEEKSRTETPGVGVYRGGFAVFNP